MGSRLRRADRSLLIASEQSFSPPPPPDLDLSLSPMGRIVKNVGESLEVTVGKNASDEARVTWTKVRRMRQVQEHTSQPFLISVLRLGADIQYKITHLKLK